MIAAIEWIITQMLADLTALLTGDVWTFVGTILALFVLWFIIKYVKGLISSSTWSN